MSFDDTAELVAEYLAKQEYVEVYAHHDADGITAGSIMCLALQRNGTGFRLRILPRINKADIHNEAATLLCDFGSALEDLPENVVVVDHHIPQFKGSYHVNPRLFGIDGDHELSASGTAYLVAQKMGDNRDLAGLAMAGMIGDGQELAGKNLDIFNEGVAQGIIEPKRGQHLVGRDEEEKLLMALHPYISGISGDEKAVRDLLGEAQGEDGTDPATMVSLAILRMSPWASPQAMQNLYGDCYELEREIIDDAHTLAAIVDACGKSGRGGLGASICLRSSGGVEEAWQIARTHRLKVIEAVRSLKPAGDFPGFYEVDDRSVASDVADTLANDCVQSTPVIVIAQTGTLCNISARCPDGIDVDIGAIIRETAHECGGYGGGHRRRAGATISCSEIENFRSGLQEVMAS